VLALLREQRQEPNWPEQDSRSDRCSDATPGLLAVLEVNDRLVRDPQGLAGEGFVFCGEDERLRIAGVEFALDWVFRAGERCDGAAEIGGLVAVDREQPSRRDEADDERDGDNAFHVRLPFPRRVLAASAMILPKSRAHCENHF